MSARISFVPPGVSTTTGGPAALIISAQHVGADLALAEVGVAVGAGPGRIARVVGVEQVDLADDLEHPLDRVGEILAGGVRVAGVEAEADLDVRLRSSRPLPEPGQGVEAAGDGVLAARGVLEVDRHLGGEHLQRSQPAADALRDVIVGVASVDDHRRRPDLRRGVAGLLQDLARAVADVVARRADVDQVRGVDVERDRRRLAARRRPCAAAASSSPAGPRGRSGRSRRRSPPPPPAASRARRARRPASSSAPSGAILLLLERDDLLDAARPVRVGHGDQRQRAEVDLLGGRAGAPGGGIRCALLARSAGCRRPGSRSRPPTGRRRVGPCRSRSG